MARKKKKEVEEIGYVASTLNINYTLPTGIVAMLSKASKKPEKEVWCQLSEIANICAHRLSTSKSQTSSWTSKKFPNTEVTLRVDMDKYISSYRWDPVEGHVPSDEKVQYSARIKISGYSSDTFNQNQINNYIADNILLGDDEEATQQ